MASTLTNLLYHVVFSTKERQNIIESSFRENLYSYMGGIVRGEKGILSMIKNIYGTNSCTLSGCFDCVIIYPDLKIGAICLCPFRTKKDQHCCTQKMFAKTL